MSSLKELSKLLGLSVSTISKALNDANDISDKTKKRVQELAEALDYQPNKLGAGLRQNKSNTIGVIIPDILNPFFAEVLYGIEKYCAGKGYDIIVCISNEKSEKEAQKIKFLKRASVDGFLIAPAAQTLQKNSFLHITKNIDAHKCVLFDRVTNQIDCDQVSVVDGQITFDATQHLAKQGFKNIAFLSAIDHLWIGKERKKGYRNALTELNRNPNQALELCANSHQAMHDTLLKWVAKTDFDAAVAADNHSGLMLTNALLTYKPEMAKKIKILGFSNQKNALLTFPKMPYVDQNAQTIGEQAAALLLERINTTTPKPFKHIKIEALYFFE